MSWGHRLAAFAGLFVLAVSGLALVDVLTAPPSVAVKPDARARQLDADLAPGRVFVLLIDSLRYETAISAELMPHLAAMRARSTYARVTPTRDAVTVPCLRAAFTGRDRTRVFGFVENFLKGNAGLESIFTALADAGRSAAVYSDGAFDQFGDRGIARFSNGDPVGEGGDSEDDSDHVDEQNATFPLALAEYLSGKRDLVVMHVTYTDHVAHEVGVGAPLYKQRFRVADALVARLDRELPAGDTLLVMGDHGHDAIGRHAVGLDVPTYALYRGPRFAAGMDLGTVAIREHRYLLGFGLGVPLPRDYAGERHPSALRAGSLGGYAAAASGRIEVSPGVPPAAHLAYGLGGLILAGLFAIWLRLWAAFVQRDVRSTPTLVAPRVAGLCGLVGAVLVIALGALFPRVRPLVHEPTYLTLTLIWLALWTGALVLTWRTQRLELGSLVLAVPLFFAVPTVYRYGAPAAMGPAWLGFLLCVGLLTIVGARARPPLGAAVLAGMMLVPFGFAESSGFRFDEWILWPPDALPSGFLLLSLIAKWIVLVPALELGRASPAQSVRAWLRPALPFAYGLLTALLLASVQHDEAPSRGRLAWALGMLVFALSEARARGAQSPVAVTACVGAVLWLHHYAVRLPVSAYYWQDCLLAALVLSARVVRPLPSPARAYARALLLLFAFFASGWVSFAWTLHRLEWRFLYDFWSAAFVENHVAAFLPLLMGRFALPLIAARILLWRELPADADAHARRALGLAWILAGTKVASLMFWSYGTAFVSVASDVYLEAVQETSLATVLLLGLL